MEKSNVLVVEDEAITGLLIRTELEEMGHSVAGVYASAEEAIEKIRELNPDLVLMDIKLQGEMDGIEAAGLIGREYGLPVIFLTAHSEEATIESARVSEPYGYILKPFSARELFIAVEVARYKHKIDREKEELTGELKAALDKAKLLSGMLPICSACKKIRDDKGYWNQIESYISDHSEAEFTHGICPDCAKKIYPKYFEE